MRKMTGKPLARKAMFALALLSAPFAETSAAAPDDDVVQAAGVLYSVDVGMKTATVCGAADTVSHVAIKDRIAHGGGVFPVVGIAAQAFEYRSSLISVTVPSSVARIGTDAFYGCSRLESVEMASSVASIGMRAFFDCCTLKTIVCRAVTPPLCAYNAFGGTDKNHIVLTVPKKSRGKYRAAAGWSEFCNVESIEARPATPAAGKRQGAETGGQGLWPTPAFEQAGSAMPLARKN